MTDSIKTKLNELMKEVVIDEFINSDIVTIVIPSTNNWKYPLPDFVKGSSYIKIEISNWSKEESFYDDKGINIVLAFGNDENEKFFKWDEIKAVVSSDGNIIIMKPYDTIEFAPPPNLTMKDIMHDNEGQKKSMESLLKRNPHLKR